MLPYINNMNESLSTGKKPKKGIKQRIKIKEDLKQEKNSSCEKIYHFKSSLFTNKSQILTQKLCHKSVDYDKPKQIENKKIINDFKDIPQSPIIPKNVKAYHISKKKINFEEINNNNKIFKKKTNSDINNENINREKNFINTDTNIENLRYQIEKKPNKNNNDLTKRIVEEIPEEEEENKNPNNNKVLKNHKKNLSFTNNISKSNIKKEENIKKSSNRGISSIIIKSMMKEEKEIKQIVNKKENRKNIYAKKLFSFEIMINQGNKICNNCNMKKDFLENNSQDKRNRNYGGYYLKYKNKKKPYYGRNDNRYVVANYSKIDN